MKTITIFLVLSVLFTVFSFAQIDYYAYLNPEAPTKFDTLHCSVNSSSELVSYTSQRYQFEGWNDGSGNWQVLQSYSHNKTFHCPTYGCESYKQYRCRVLISDYYNSETVYSNNLTIINRKPQIITMELHAKDYLNRDDPTPNSEDNLFCNVSQYIDADGHDVTILYSWFNKTGAATYTQIPGQSSQELSSDFVHSGNTIQCRATPQDHLGLNGTTITRSVYIDDNSTRHYRWFIPFGHLNQDGRVSLLEQQNIPGNRFVLFKDQTADLQVEFTCTDRECGFARSSMDGVEDNAAYFLSTRDVEYNYGSSELRDTFHKVARFPELSDPQCMSGMLSTDRCNSVHVLESSHDASEEKYTIHLDICSDTNVYSPHVQCAQTEQIEVLILEQNFEQILDLNCNQVSEVYLSADNTVVSSHMPINLRLEANVSGNIIDVTDYSFFYGERPGEIGVYDLHLRSRVYPTVEWGVVSVSGSFCGQTDTIEVIDVTVEQTYSRLCQEIDQEQWLLANLFRSQYISDDDTVFVLSSVLREYAQSQMAQFQTISPDDLNLLELEYETVFQDARNPEVLLFPLHKSFGKQRPCYGELPSRVTADEGFVNEDAQYTSWTRTTAQPTQACQFQCNRGDYVFNNDCIPTSSDNFCASDLVLVGNSTLVFFDSATVIEGDDDYLQIDENFHPVLKDLDPTDIGKQNFCLRSSFLEEGDLYIKNLCHGQPPQNADYQEDSWLYHDGWQFTSWRHGSDTTEPCTFDCQDGFYFDGKDCVDQEPDFSLISDIPYFDPNTTLRPYLDQATEDLKARLGVSDPEELIQLSSSLAYLLETILEYPGLFISYNTSSEDAQIAYYACNPDAQDYCFRPTNLDMCSFGGTCFTDEYEVDFVRNVQAIAFEHVQNAQWEGWVPLEEDLVLNIEYAKSDVSQGEPLTLKKGSRLQFNNLEYTSESNRWDGFFSTKDSSPTITNVGLGFQTQQIGDEKKIPFFAKLEDYSDLACETASPGVWGLPDADPPSLECTEDSRVMCAESAPSYLMDGIEYSDSWFSPSSQMYCSKPMIGGVEQDWGFYPSDGGYEQFHTYYTVENCAPGPGGDRSQSVDNMCIAYQYFVNRTDDGRQLDLNIWQYNDGERYYSVHQDVSAFNEQCYAVIDGYILNQQAEPIEGARVELDIIGTRNQLQRFKNTTTNQDGYYQFADIPATHYRILAAKPGYDTRRTPTHVLFYNENLQVNMTLLTGQCEADCTLTSGNTCVAACHGLNGCSFYNETVAQQLDGMQRGIYVPINDTHSVLSCTGDPTASFIGTDDADQRITCPSGSTLVIVERVAIQDGESVRVRIPVCR
ncbi:MAG: carboxypeptidase-like regulatory domain-containing protein [Candidatus Woesearchaeota archaeon]